jgi:hydrogenase expression/formation protein HypD
LKFVDEFRNADTVKNLAKAIKRRAGMEPLVFMEVCGTHTMAVARFGIRERLPDAISLISGPGCPVCVTPVSVVDRIVAMSRLPGVIVATFGDMMRVPGSFSSLEAVRAEEGADVRIVTSPLDALSIAAASPDRRVVFMGVGFETTAPAIAASIERAKSERISNYFVLSAHKVMPPPMEALSQGEIGIHGYLCPGHVSAIIGSHPYEVLANQYGIGCVISGFEPTDILQSILMLVGQCVSGKPRVEIQYNRVVHSEGNLSALALMNLVFEPTDSEWRGLGVIPKSGLAIRSGYRDWDAEVQIPVDPGPSVEPEGCRCGEVLRGLIRPAQCPLFGGICTTDHPIGACMVSSEGACAASYRYERTAAS